MTSLQIPARILFFPPTPSSLVYLFLSFNRIVHIHTHVHVMCIDNITINPFRSRARANTERYSILSSPPSLLPPFLPTRKTPPSPASPKRKEKRERKKKERKEQERKGKEPQYPVQSPVPRTPSKGLHYTDTHTRTYGSVESTQRTVHRRPQTQQRDFHQPSHDWGGRGGSSRGRALRGGRIVVMPGAPFFLPICCGGCREGSAGRREAGTGRPGDQARLGDSSAACLPRAPSSPPPPNNKTSA